LAHVKFKEFLGMRIEVVGIVVTSLAAFVFSGCDQGATKAAKPKATENHDRDEKKAEIVHGKNGGHIIKLTPTDLVAEWCHSSDNDVIKVFVLDEKATANHPIKADSVTIRPTSGNKRDPFTLAAVSANENGESAEYKLDDKQLALAMTLGVVLEIKVGEKTYTAEIPAHAPHSH
jgi:hypothetical protein